MGIGDHRQLQYVTDFLGRQPTPIRNICDLVQVAFWLVSVCLDLAKQRHREPTQRILVVRGRIKNHDLSLGFLEPSPPEFDQTLDQAATDFFFGILVVRKRPYERQGVAKLPPSLVG